MISGRSPQSFPWRALPIGSALCQGAGRRCFWHGGLTMRLVRTAACAVMMSCLGILPGSLFFAVIAMAPAAAQQGDLNAILKRQTQFMDAGNYAAALVEARKAEALVKARFGVAHANYGIAL